MGMTGHTKTGNTLSDIVVITKPKKYKYITVPG